MGTGDPQTDDHRLSSTPTPSENRTSQPTNTSDNRILVKVCATLTSSAKPDVLEFKFRLQCPKPRSKTATVQNHRRLDYIPNQEADGHVATPGVRRLSVHQGERHIQDLSLQLGVHPTFYTIGWVPRVSQIIHAPHQPKWVRNTHTKNSSPT